MQSFGTSLVGFRLTRRGRSSSASGEDDKRARMSRPYNIPKTLFAVSGHHGSRDLSDLGMRLEAKRLAVIEGPRDHQGIDLACIEREVRQYDLCAGHGHRRV